MKYLGTILLAAILIESCADSNSQNATVNKPAIANEYVCLPCGQDCDTIAKNETGNCSKCSMKLVEKSSILFKNMAAKDLYQHIVSAGTDNVVLLDVRTPEEFNGTAPDKFGRLKNAINIPVQQLETRINELEKYKDKEIIVYCSHSHRSPAASYLLTQKGFNRVTNLQHGMHLWKQEVTDQLSNDSLYVSQE